VERGFASETLGTIEIKIPAREAGDRPVDENHAAPNRYRPLRRLARIGYS
jgi:hypothetical protein